VHLLGGKEKGAVLSIRITFPLGSWSNNCLSTKHRNEEIKYIKYYIHNKSNTACELQMLHTELKLSILTQMLLHLYFSFLFLFFFLCVGGYSKVKKKELPVISTIVYFWYYASTYDWKLRITFEICEISCLWQNEKSNKLFGSWNKSLNNLPSLYWPILNVCMCLYRWVCNIEACNALVTWKQSRIAETALHLHLRYDV
jgi:hypothetical protein